MDIDIFLEDDHPHRDLQHLSPEYLRHALNLQYERIKAMVDQNFTDALATLVAAVKANNVPDQAAIDAAVAASKAEDLQAVTDLTAAQTPPTPPAG